MKQESPHQKMTGRSIIVLVFFVAVVIIGGYLVLSKDDIQGASHDTAEGFIIRDGDQDVDLVEPPKPKVTHLVAPEQTKVGYMTSWVAGTASIRDPLLDFFEESEFNSVIIDIKLSLIHI